ncbi:uncharacterized protein LOC126903159 [Daktulosphaira vitifoliae]|uniref:uncharacterized protein LOC126903159 n=1 Tax=Daktulosphaira vitifoliae TaxID=58002 RepID=UPI0021A9F031|nr:uncharacterized protein LOC126903159 [Daktulosphaira vitifoliae]
MAFKKQTVRFYIIVIWSLTIVNQSLFVNSAPKKKPPISKELYECILEITITNEMVTSLSDAHTDNLLFQCVSKWPYENLISNLIPKDNSISNHIPKGENITRIIANEEQLQRDIHSVNPNANKINKQEAKGSVHFKETDFSDATFFRKNFLLKKSFNRIYTIQLANNMLCHDDNDVKCKTLGILLFCKDNNVFNQRAWCDFANKQCRIDTIDSTNTQTEKIYYETMINNELYTFEIMDGTQKVVNFTELSKV